MALIRRSGARFSANIWPGFVDAMTAILLVLMFVLSIFMIVQSILRDTITGQNSEIGFLNIELNQIKNDLGLERSKLARLDARYEEKLQALNLTEKNFTAQKIKNEQLDQQLILKTLNLKTLETNFVGLTSKLQTMQDQMLNNKTVLSSSRQKEEQLKNKLMVTDAAAKERMALLSILRAKFDISRQRIQTFQSQVAGLILKNKNLVQAVGQSENQFNEIRSENELVKLALSNARKEFDEKTQVARLAAARAEALEALVSDFQHDRKILDSLNVNLLEKIEDKEIIISEQIQELNKKNKKLIQFDKNSILEQVAIANLKKKMSFKSEELGLLTLTLDAERQKALKTLELLASARAVQIALKENNKQVTFSNNSAEQA